MALDVAVFKEALDVFHHYADQNTETLAQLQKLGVLPNSQQESIGFSTLDIGAGQGYLPSLMQPFCEAMVLVEPNPVCVKSLQAQFPKVYHAPWGVEIAETLQKVYPEGFNLVTMSHMLYHFEGLEDIRAKICLALQQVTPGGALAIVLNTPTAIMAEVGIAYQLHQGRVEEAKVNQEIHRHCHDIDFYTALSDQIETVSIHEMAAPLVNVPDRETLVCLLRMCLLHPLSQSEFNETEVDGYLSQYLLDRYPDQAFPTDVYSADRLILLRLKS